MKQTNYTIDEDRTYCAGRGRRLRGKCQRYLYAYNDKVVRWWADPLYDRSTRSCPNYKMQYTD